MRTYTLCTFRIWTMNRWTPTVIAGNLSHAQPLPPPKPRRMMSSPPEMSRGSTTARTGPLPFSCSGWRNSAMR
ncbi:Uncharacterised protein [Mycobacteroides abscessus subsp. abscessus]|nr:Uncharacterised protein [Mycobacteroides abscessus subsp. abscessus]